MTFARCYNKIDNGGPYRDDGNPSWPGGGGPMYDVIHPITNKVCKKPKRGWVFPNLKVMNKQIADGRVVFGKDETTIPSIKTYLFEKTESVMKSVLYSYAQTASQEFDKIFNGKKVFENPKHFEDLRSLTQYFTNDGDLIVDFFAGSGTCAHGLFLDNHFNNKAKRFILVQLPEPIKGDSEVEKTALSFGYKSIADICRDRIKRVIKQLRLKREEELPFNNEEDLGFRDFILSESHFKRWAGAGERDTAALAEQMTMFADPLEPGWQEEDVLWEIALKEGLSLTSRIERVLEPKGGARAGNTVWRVTDEDKEQSLLVCLDARLDPATPAALNLTKDTIFICRDLALDDNLAANLALQCRLKTI